MCAPRLPRSISNKQKIELTTIGNSNSISHLVSSHIILADVAAENSVQKQVHAATMLEDDKH